MDKLKPKIILRDKWKAKKTKINNNYLNPRNIIIHHSGEPKDAWSKKFENDEIAFMKRIQEYHIQGRSWDDIGYHFGIGLNGSILEGRIIKFQGVHCPSMNYRSIGIVIHGNYNYRTLKFNQIKSIIKLLVWLCTVFNINSNDIFMHKEINKTQCPGKNISKKMNYLKNIVDYKLKKINERIQ